MAQAWRLKKKRDFAISFEEKGKASFCDLALAAWKGKRSLPDGTLRARRTRRGREIVTVSLWTQVKRGRRHTTEKGNASVNPETTPKRKRVIAIQDSNSLTLSREERSRRLPYFWGRKRRRK